MALDPLVQRLRVVPLGVSPPYVYVERLQDAEYEFTKRGMLELPGSSNAPCLRSHGALTQHVGAPLGALTWREK